MVAKRDKSHLEKVRRIAVSGIIASLYFTLTMILSPISFGNIQIRLAEGLGMLCLLDYKYLYGVSLGCFLANIVSAFLGVNVLGMTDCLIGTIATIISCLSIYCFRERKIKNIPVLSIIFPGIINGILIGGELTFILNKEMFVIFALEVFIGEVISLYLGYLLVRYIKHIELL